MCEPALAGERSFFRAPRRTHDEHAHRYPRLKPWATILTPASPTDTTLTFMSRYIKKFRSTTALGPTEERGVPLWVGYDIEGIDDDLSDLGLLKADDLSDDELRERGVTTFTRVDQPMYEKLGIARKR